MIGGGEGDVIGERKVRVGGAAEVGDIIQKAPVKDEEGICC